MDKVYFVGYRNLEDDKLDDTDLIAIYSDLDLVVKDLFEKIIPCISGEHCEIAECWFDELKNFVIHVQEYTLNKLHIFNQRSLITLVNYKNVEDVYMYSVGADEHLIYPLIHKYVENNPKFVNAASEI